MIKIKRSKSKEELIKEGKNQEKMKIKTNKKYKRRNNKSKINKLKKMPQFYRRIIKQTKLKNNKLLNKTIIKYKKKALVCPCL